ncbi:MAG: ATP-grasp domain-containing protein, partial [Planctomycetaceae bacterium]
LAGWGPLWGNPAATLAAVRDPVQLAHLGSMHQLTTLPVRSSDQPPPSTGEWMLKPLGGAAGRGVVPWTSATLDHPTLSEPHVFQKRVLGRPGSALFVARPGQTDCLGLTWQLPTPSTHPWPHAWTGNLLPEEPLDRLLPALLRAGDVLARETGLRGLFGIDFVDDGRTPWLIEVNPRYTGSTELFEFHTQSPLLQMHAQACAPQASLPPLPAIDAPAVPQEHCLGKAIVYAPAATRLTVELPLPPVVPLWTFPELADIPAVGQIFARGDPVCTVFAHAATQNACLEQLHDHSQRVLALLAPL